MAEIQLLTYDEAVALLPDDEQIHAILDGDDMQLGADWSREDILSLLETTDRREVTGPAAQASGHGLAAGNKEEKVIASRQSDELVFESRHGGFAFRPEGVNLGKRLSCSHQPHGARCLIILASLSCWPG